MKSRNIATNPRPVTRDDLAELYRVGGRMKITGVKTHIVDTLIPEEHRVRSGAGYKLAPPGRVRRDHDRRGASRATGPARSAAPRSTSAPSPRSRTTRSRPRSSARTRTGSSTSGTRSTTASILRVHGAALGRRRDPLRDRHRALGHQGQGARRAGLPAARRRVPRSGSLLLELRVLGYARAAPWPRRGRSSTQGFKAFKVKVGLDVENDIASPARDPRGRRLRRRHARRREPVLHAPPRAAGRPRAREARRASSSRSRSRSTTSTGTRSWPSGSTSASRPARTCTRAGTSCRSSRSRRDPRRAGRRFPLRRHQRGEADRRPGGRLPPPRDPAHVLGRADDRREPPRRRRVLERADHRVRPHVQRDPGEARDEPARRCTTA